MSKISQKKEYVSNKEIEPRLVNGNQTKDIDIVMEKIIKNIYEEKMKKVKPINGNNRVRKNK